VLCLRPFHSPRGGDNAACKSNVCMDSQPYRAALLNMIMLCKWGNRSRINASSSACTCLST
jgi:hypothetical protein